MTITVLISVCTATLVGFFAGVIITALVIKSNHKRDDDKFQEMLDHQQVVENRLSRYSDHSERTADALEAIADTMGRSE